MATVKDLELLTMIQHFVSNIDLENSTFSKTKKGIFFILKSNLHVYIEHIPEELFACAFFKPGARANG